MVFVAGQPNEPSKPSWLQRLSTWLLQSLALGLGINALSVDVAYRGPAVVAAFVAVLAAADWLRRLPPGAPLVTIASRAVLTAAATAAIVSVFGPAGWEGYAVITASLLAIAAVLIPSSPDTAIKTLAGTAVIGGGVAALRHAKTFTSVVTWLQSLKRAPEGEITLPAADQGPDRLPGVPHGPGQVP